MVKGMQKGWEVGGSYRVGDGRLLKGRREKVQVRAGGRGRGGERGRERDATKMTKDREGE